METAIRKCREENVLTEFLRKYAAEVYQMLDDEVTKEAYGDIREADGIFKGRLEGEKLG